MRHGLLRLRGGVQRVLMRVSGEKNVAELVQCIRDNNDCADISLTTARIISRFTRTDFKLAGAQLRACVQACQSCGAICEKHGSHMNIAVFARKRVAAAQKRAKHCSRKSRRWSV